MKCMVQDCLCEATKTVPCEMGISKESMDVNVCEVHYGLIFNGSVNISMELKEQKEEELLVKPDEYDIDPTCYDVSGDFHKEELKTCGRCIHDEESENIVGSSCYLCKRNTTDNRIDWFEERKG